MWVWAAVEKTYEVNRFAFRGSKYQGDPEGLAQWFYATVDAQADNLTITIHGDFHETFPNPEHLTVEYKWDGGDLGRLHMSVGQDGHFYDQRAAGAGKRRRKKPKRKRNKKRRTRTKKR